MSSPILSSTQRSVKKTTGWAHLPSYFQSTNQSLTSHQQAATILFSHPPIITCILENLPEKSLRLLIGIRRLSRSCNEAAAPFVRERLVIKSGKYLERIIEEWDDVARSYIKQLIVHPQRLTLFQREQGPLAELLSVLIPRCPNLRHLAIPLVPHHLWSMDEEGPILACNKLVSIDMAIEDWTWIFMIQAFPAVRRLHIRSTSFLRHERAYHSLCLINITHLELSGRLLSMGRPGVLLPIAKLFPGLKSITLTTWLDDYCVNEGMLFEALMSVLHGLSLLEEVSITSEFEDNEEVFTWMDPRVDQRDDGNNGRDWNIGATRCQQTRVIVGGHADYIPSLKVVNIKCRVIHWEKDGVNFDSYAQDKDDKPWDEFDYDGWTDVPGPWYLLEAFPVREVEWMVDTESRIEVDVREYIEDDGVLVYQGKDRTLDLFPGMW